MFFKFLLQQNIIFICGSLLLSSNAFSYGGEEIEPIYCPQEIICGDTKGENCQVIYNKPSDAKYFGISSSPYVNGTYKFQLATATFHSYFPTGYCQYKTNNKGYTVNLFIKPESNIEAYYNPPNPSAWIFNRVDAKCNDESDASPYSCPFKERLGFVIHNINLSGGVFAAINGVKISDLISSPNYVGIIYDDVLIGCGGEQECSIDILSGKGANYGSLKVDMDTMKILEVNPLYPTKIQINKIEPFNSIEISYPNLTR